MHFYFPDSTARILKILLNPIFWVLFVFLAWAIWETQSFVHGLCPKEPTSEQEVREAVGAYFNSGSNASLKFIRELRQFGMTEEEVVDIKNNCRHCFIQRGGIVVPEDNEW